MLRQSFPLARDLGIDRLLVTCDETNLASRAVIERCGGVLEDARPRDDGITRRYWIAL
jgi:predicted acetyltransferase